MNKLKVLAVAPLAVIAFALPATASAATYSVSVSPASGLSNGQTVTASGSNWPANLGIFVLECSSASSQAACDTGHLVPVTTSSTGSWTASVTVRTGTIGNGTCSAGGTCYIAAGDAAQTASGAAAITFKAATVTTTPTTAATTTTTTTTARSTAPTSVNAGSGGGADRNGMPISVVLLACAGVAALGVGGVRLARR